MSKINLSDLTTLENQGSAIAAINNNNATIETAFDNTVSRDGTAPNMMLADLDMNGHTILNCVNVPPFAAGVSSLTRPKLLANGKMYVRTDGNDSNDGLTNTPTGAKKTIQNAWDTICNTYDLSGFYFEISVQPGTYNAGLSALNVPVGGGIFLHGDDATPSNVFINAPGGAFNIGNVGFGSGGLQNGWSIVVSGFKVGSSNGVGNLINFNGTYGANIGNIEFSGSTNGAHLYVNTALVYIGGNDPRSSTGNLNTWKVTGSGTTGYHINCDVKGVVQSFESVNFTIIGTPHVTAAGLQAGAPGSIIQIFAQDGGWNITGSFTGARFFLGPSANIWGNFGEDDSDLHADWFPADQPGTRVDPEVLTAYGSSYQRNYYVRTDGNDNNHGRLNTAAGAFRTIQHAITFIQRNIDTLNSPGFVQINVGAGSFDGFVSSNIPYLQLYGVDGVGSTIITNTVANTPSIDWQGGSLLMGNVKITNTGTGQFSTGIYLRTLFPGIAFPYVFVDNGTVFGACTNGACITVAGGQLDLSGNFTVTGNSPYFLRVIGGTSFVNFFAATVTLTGSPVFVSGFVNVTQNATVSASTSFSGATGASSLRYSATMNGTIQTFGGGANVFPGTVAGTTSTGGQYA